MSAEKYQVQLFLLQIKQFASEKLTIVNRGEYLETLGKLGITHKQAKQIILDLSYKDYYRGPNSDPKYPKDEVWEFGKKINGIELYIKLKIIQRLNWTKCISFHPAKNPIEYPFQR